MNKLIQTQQQVKQLRADFMEGNGKGGEKDSLTRQRPSVRSVLAEETITDLYASNRIVQNIIDIPAEDMTRAWFDLRMKDDKLKNDIMSKLADLNAREAFQKMRQFERLRGDGFISLGVTQTYPNVINLSKELTPDMIQSVDYIHAFSSTKVSDFLTNEDVFSPNFGQVELLKLRQRKAAGIHVPETTNEKFVHASRLLHDCTRRMEDETRGQSLIEPLLDVFTVLDTALWSVGQILYDYTFKVYKSKGIENLTREEKRELNQLTDFMFRTEALAIVSVDEDLRKESSSVAGIDQLLNFVWDYLAGCARMPKTVIKGQEAGTIAGAQYDVMNYYSRIAAAQENEMKPKLEKLIRALLWSEGELGGRIDPDSLEWEIQFNPLWSIDSKTDAEIRKMTAETDAISIASGVVAPDEVRQKRTGQFGLEEEMKLSGDSMSEEERAAIAKEIYQAWEEKGNA